jgi:bacterioferritin-associated ferredoxin
MPKPQKGRQRPSLPIQRAYWHPSLTEDRIVDAVERHATTLDDLGFCLSCGAEAHGVEPDARRYVCESCGARQVYGADELLLRIM